MRISADKIAEIYARVREEGIAWFASRMVRKLKDWASPPWICLYWLPLSEATDLRNPATKDGGDEKLRALLTRLLKSVELKAVTALSDLKPQEYQALKDSVGASDIPVYERRLSQGIELHILFVDKKVAGTLSFVFGKTHRFQHVVLTDRDAMALDGRVDPKYRGRGLYPIFLSLAIERLREKGIERLFIDTNENNEEASRSFTSVGFRFLLRFRIEGGRYRFDREPV